MKRRARLMALLVTLSVAGVFAADWPGYLGPRRDGTSTEKGILRTWPKEGPKVLWTVPLGAGFAGPAVSRGKVYLLDRDDKVGDILRVYDFATGKELWNFAYDAPGRFEFPGSRTTPTVDGNIVYIAGPLGDLHAIDINTHKPVWRKNIWKDFGGGTRVHRVRAAWRRHADAAAWRAEGWPPAPPTGQAGPPPAQAGAPAAPPGCTGRNAAGCTRRAARLVRHSARMVSAEAPRRFPCGASPRTRSSIAACVIVGPAGARGGRGRLRQAHGGTEVEDGLARWHRLRQPVLREGRW